jgi:hypothetical protein
VAKTKKYLFRFISASKVEETVIYLFTRLSELIIFEKFKKKHSKLVEK